MVGDGSGFSPVHRRSSGARPLSKQATVMFDHVLGRGLEIGIYN